MRMSSVSELSDSAYLRQGRIPPILLLSERIKSLLKISGNLITTKINSPCANVTIS